MLTKFKEKESLVQEIGMKFDEAVELFSEETLQSMSMMNIIGGDGTPTYGYCAQCGQCVPGCQAQCVTGCQNQCPSCGSSGDSGGSGGSSGSSGSTTTTTTTTTKY